MQRRLIVSLVAAAALSTSLAFTQDKGHSDKKPAQDKTKAPPAKPTAAPEIPAGLDPAEMQAYVEAATPGPMHAHLLKGTGVWDGKTSMWMAPDSPPLEGTCVSTITAVMNGHYVKTDTTGESPIMGQFLGLGINGYDNVSKTFQSSWIDNMGTGMMQGTGTLSPDGKVMTWTFNCTCPVTKKPIVMREVETATGPDSMKLEMYAPYPKTGKEFKSMEIVFTRKPGTGPANATANATESK